VLNSDLEEKETVRYIYIHTLSLRQLDDYIWNVV